MPERGKLMWWETITELRSGRINTYKYYIQITCIPLPGNDNSEVIGKVSFDYFY